MSTRPDAWYWLGAMTSSHEERRKARESRALQTLRDAGEYALWQKANILIRLGRKLIRQFEPISGDILESVPHMGVQETT